MSDTGKTISKPGLNPDSNSIWTKELLYAAMMYPGWEKAIALLWDEVSYPNVASHRKRNAMPNGSTSCPEPSPTSEQRASSVDQGETLLEEELGSHLTSGPIFSDLA
ncbi:hypothetical protein F5X97DRAFT_323586 [Nemania serpens]|nr:hypothetical protein F5X97DRAFT_323586 [Nemania serpens]